MNPLTDMLNTLQKTKNDLQTASSLVNSMATAQKAYKDGKITQEQVLEIIFNLTNEVSPVLEKYSGANW